MSRVSPSLLLPALLCCAGAVHAADGCRYAPVAALPIRAASLPGQLTVDGLIDGKPAVMWLGLGSSETRLMLAAVEKFGLHAETTGKYSYGIGGAAVTYAVLVKDFSVGPAHSGKASMRVIGNTTMAPTFDAIVGADFLLQGDLEVALADKELRFFRPTGCADTFLAYWDKDAMEIPFGGTANKNANPHIIVELNGVKMEATISTGLPHTTVSRRAAERAGVKVDSPDVASIGKARGVGAEKVDRWSATFPTFTIGSETIQNASFDILDTPPQGSPKGMPDVMLGVDFLRAHRVLFAMGQQRLYVSYTGGEVFAKRAGAH